MRSNLTQANSDWTAEKVFQSLGVPAVTLYPPVTAPAKTMAWADRRRGFIAMGRISPEKEYERIIRILREVKRRVPEITLTIVGTHDRGARTYLEQLQSLIAALDASGWVTFRQDLSRPEVHALIASHRYGIHGMREEHFGMAPAEMVRGGMIVWVPNGGGQVEIVGNAPALRFDSERQAAEQIVEVLSDAGLEETLRDQLARHSERFSVEQFISRFRTIVAEFGR
jgi:glycosyltransferase involved in cell wall biosynthesis